MIFQTFNTTGGGFLNKLGIFGQSFSQIVQSVQNDAQRWKDSWNGVREALRLANGGDYVLNSLELANEQMPKESKSKLAFLRSGYLRSPFSSEVINEPKINQYKQFQAQLEAGEEASRQFVKQTHELDSSILGYADACGYANMSLQGFTEYLNQNTIAAKAAQLGWEALKVAGNMLAMAAISAVIQGFYQLITLSDTVAEQARESADTFNTAAQDISSYKKQIDDLYKTINDSSSSVEQVTTARENLLQVQDEMIEKFGTEAGVIDVVTQAIKGQTDALDQLTAKKWNETLNSFNKSGGFIGKLANTVGYGGYHSNEERMEDLYGHADTTIVTGTFSGFVEDQEQYKRFLAMAKSLGAELGANDYGDEVLRVKGNADEVYQTLLAIQGVTKEMQLPDQVSNTFGDYASQVKETRDEYKDFFDQYTRYEKILSTSGQESGYDDIYKNLVNQKAKIDEAFASGDDETREQAIQQYASLLSDGMAKAANDEDVKDYFHNMYPDIKEEVDSWRFKVKFEADTDGFKTSIEDYVKKFTDKGYSAQDIAEYNPTQSNDVELNEAYYGLQGVFTQNNLEIAKSAELFTELGLAVSRTQAELQKKFNIDLSGTDEATKFVLANLETAAQVTDRNVDSVNDLVIAIQKIQNATSKVNPTDSKLNMIADINAMSEGFEELDKIKSSIIDDDKAFDFSLFDDKNFTETFSGLTEEYKDFIETVSKSPKDINACQGAFDNLLTAWIESEGILDKVDESNASVTTAMLKNMGVANAEEIVTDKLARQQDALAAEKYYNANASDVLANATVAEYNEFLNEANLSDTAKVALAQLELSKLAVNNTHIDTSSDIDQIINLANAAGAGAEALAKVARAKAVYAKAESTGLTSAGDFRQLEEADKVLSDISSGSYDWSFQIDANKFKTPVYGGGNKSSNTSASNGGSGDKSGSDSTKDFDWIERRQKLFNDAISDLDSKASSSRLKYIGINDDTTTRALDLFDQIHNQAVISMDDFNWLAQAASSAGMSLDEFYQHIQNGGGVSRASYLDEEIAKIKETLPEYQQIAEQYRQQYEEIVSKLPEEYRSKIEFGGKEVEKLRKEDGSEEVEDAIELYDKYKEAIKDVDEKEETLYSKTKQKYDDQNEYLENQKQLLEDRNDLINKQVDYLNATGALVSASTYENLIANLDQQKVLVEQQLENRKRELAEMIANNPNYEGSEDYYELQQSIDEAKLSLLDLSTQQAEYNDTLLQLPIENAQKLVDMYDAITTAMENWKNEIESAGKTVNADYYQEQIKNGQATIRQLQNQRSAVEDVIEEYETGSDKWIEMNSKLNDIDSSISSIVVNMNEWNEAMLQIPIDKMQELVDDLQTVKDALDDLNSEHLTVISAVTGAIDDQREAWEEAQEAETDAIQDKIDAIQDQLDLLDEQNEALDLQVAKEQALKELEDAKTQKKNRVIRDGQVVYEADQDAIRDATDSLQDAEADLKKHELETEKEKLEDELEAINDRYDDLYDKLDKIANKWEQIQPDREQLSNEHVADRYLGDDWINKVLSGNDNDIYTAFKELYDQNVDSQEQYESQINSTEQIQTLVNTYIEAYRSGTLTRDQAMSGIRNVLASVNHELTAGDNVNNILTFLSTQNETGATTNDILTSTQNQLSDTASDIMESLDVYEENSNMITRYMSTFPELQATVSDMRDGIDDVDNSLDDIEDALNDGFDDVVEALDSWREKQEDDEEEDDDGDTSTKYTYDAPNGWQSSDRFDGGHGKEGYEVGWTRYADGIKKGVIGHMDSEDKYMALREMATTNLEPDEQPIIAHSGEIVLNPEQQAQLLKNIQQNSFTSDMLLKPVNVPMMSRDVSQNINMQFGDLSFPDVQDVDGFAKAIARDFPGLMRQAMSKVR